ncbi:thiopeptide-type bacteriocin biosynthesis protein [Microbispora sp. RL4-1S]|uniref:Thiopeptide-type bacteriocin biosynthesis protein n=1 Tax=Microbispora oryzae TaxID=2806554 RepID=A0A940WQP4_9ACTN|nr:thiopeptide-type bacteriocin biosynthesis protein [Microbispora oryzae]MBP2708182.1 thiopeptide-type bacteriocin biosynthesis protein [Microbispora oryzae]
MAEPWISLHAFHRGGTDRLIAQAVGGLVRSLHADGLLVRYFFLRYWEGGPHLRLRLLPYARPGEVAERATTALEQHLAAHPSTVSWDAERYAAVAERYARDENLTDYDRRVRSRDGVEAVAYRPEFETYGGPEATEAAERHFCDSSRVALVLLEGETGPGRRLGFAAAALTLALAAWEPDPARLARALEAARERWDPPQDRRHRAEPSDRERAALTAQVLRSHRIAAGAERPGARDPLGAWWRSIDTLRLRALDLQAAGRFRPEPAVSSFQPPDVSRERGDILILLLRCVHLLCNRLGLPGGQETHLRHLVGTTYCELEHR